MLGLYKEMSPRFLKVYADISQSIVRALESFQQEVAGGVFPGPEHTYTIDDAELQRLLVQLRAGRGD
jgi:3-methyl-2-oxobutanoate hydroxymethyltransferase